MDMKQVLFLLFGLLCCCNSSIKPETIQVLFVGNSLTYTNDLPSLVTKYGDNNKVEIISESLTFPNYGLLDHWEDGELQELIKTGKYDFVIIQQGPSSQQLGREWLIEYGKLIGELCEENDAKLVYFMVWPSRIYYHTFDGVIKNHRDAAQINNALLAPVGEKWKAHFDNTEDFSFYGPDGFHPSISGSKLAAQIIVKTLLEAK